MYIPPHFKQEDLATIHDTMRSIGFVSLVTNTANGLIATQAPVLVDAEPTPNGTLRGHIARANAQWRSAAPEQQAMAIFTGPNAYISPQGYAAKREHGRVVPTWNYVAIHAYGKLAFSEDRELLRKIVTRLTDLHEASSAQPWKVTDAPADYIEGMLGAIIAFEMPISRIEGSWKLSQNRSEADRLGTIARLKEQGRGVVEEMEKTLPPRNGE